MFILFILIVKVYLYWTRFIYTGHITSYLGRNVLPVFPVIHSFVLIADIICIDPITSYLACNLCPVFHIYSSSVNSWCITYFPVYNLICLSIISSVRLVFFVSEYKLNPNSICIYVTPFFTSKKAIYFSPA